MLLVVKLRGRGWNPQLRSGQMHEFWSSLNYKLQIIVSKLQLKLCYVMVQDRTLNSSNIGTNGKRKWLEHPFS